MAQQSAIYCIVEPAIQSAGCRLIHLYNSNHTIHQQSVVLCEGPGRLTACSSWWPKYSPSCVLSSSAMCWRKKDATACGLSSTVPEPISAATPFTGSLQIQWPSHAIAQHFRAVGELDSYLQDFLQNHCYAGCADVKSSLVRTSLLITALAWDM